MAAPYANDPFEQGMAQAHLLMTRKQYHEARVLLTQVKMANPGRADVEDALQRAIDEEARQRGPRRRFDWGVFVRDLGPVGPPIAFGLAALVFAGMYGIPACQAAVVSGIGGTMTIENRYGFLRQVPISGQLARGGVCLAVAVALFAVALWLSRGDDP